MAWIWIFSERILVKKSSCKGSFPRNFPVASHGETLPENLVASHREALPENSNNMLSNHDPASKLLSKKTSLRKTLLRNFFERFRVETSFHSIYPPSRKFLSRSIVEKQTSCAKSCVWFSQNHSYSSRKKFLMWQSFYRKTKQKKTWTSTNVTMLLQIFPSEIRWGMPKASSDSMLQPFDTGRRAGDPTEKQRLVRSYLIS